MTDCFGKGMIYGFGIICQTCGIDFSSEEFYRKHLNGKQHARREKRLRTQIITGTSSLVRTNNDVRGYENGREKYKQRKTGNFDRNFNSYVWNVVACWTCRLVSNPTVEDFKISINDNAFKELGHVVLRIKYIDYPGIPGTKRTYAIRFNHISSQSVKSVDSFSQGPFSIDNVVSKISELKGDSCEDVKFVIFTTASLSPMIDTYKPVMLSFCDTCRKLLELCICTEKGASTEYEGYVKPSDRKRKNDLNTSDDTLSVHRLIVTNSELVLPNIYFYTGQKHLRQLPESLREDVTDLFGIPREAVDQFSRNYVKYLENWSLGKFGGTYTLTKEDVLVKWAHLLLENFVATPKVRFVHSEDAFDVWNAAIRDVDVTVLKATTDLSEICEPINLFIQRELGLAINITNDTVHFSSDLVKSLSNKTLKSFYFEEIYPDSDLHVPMNKVYVMFWKAGLTPLILQVEDEKYVLQLLNKLKYLGLTRRYLLKTLDWHDNPSSRYKNLSFFVSVNDVVSRLPPSLFDRVNIKVPPNFEMSLSTIRETDDYFLGRISAGEFFDMVLGKYAFKLSNGGSRLKDRSPKEDLKLLLSEDRMLQLQHYVEFTSGHKTPRRGNILRGLHPHLFTISL